MTKKDIVKAISHETGLTLAQAQSIVDKTFQSIMDAIVNERRIELRNFGVFEVKKRKARAARNPKTMQPIQVPERHVVVFKPSKEMEKRVQDAAERRQNWQQIVDNSPACQPDADQPDVDAQEGS